MENMKKQNKLANYLIIILVTYILVTVLSRVGSSVTFEMMMNGKIEESVYITISNVTALLTIIIVSFIISLVVTISGFILSKNPESMSGILADNFETTFIISSIYYYAMMLLPVPFYILILFREGKKINWFILLKLATLFTIVIKDISTLMRNFLDYNLKIISIFDFDTKFPILGFIRTNRVISTINSYLWVVGVIIIIIQVKKALKAQNDLLDEV